MPTRDGFVVVCPKELIIPRKIALATNVPYAVSGMIFLSGSKLLFYAGGWKLITSA